MMRPEQNQVLSAPLRQSARNALEQLIINRETELEQLRNLLEEIPFDALTPEAEAVLWKMIIEYHVR